MANFSQTIRTRKINPSISFAGQGYILPNQLSKGIPVTALNVSQADIDFFRVKPDRLIHFLNYFRNHNSVPYYQSPNIHKNTDLVYSARYEIDIKNNVRTQTALPIQYVKELQGPGVYLAILRGAGTYNYANAATYFSISDIGLHARVYEHQVTIHVQSLKTGHTMPDVKVKVYDNNNNNNNKIMTPPLYKYLRLEDAEIGAYNKT